MPAGITLKPVSSYFWGAVDNRAPRAPDSVRNYVECHGNTVNGVHVELTVVMPCLNEAETVATCVRKAVQFISDSGVSGEVVVADNGSTDGSRQLAEEAGARVVPIPERGYGNALMGGIIAARGEYVIMGDADDSYDFTNLMPFIVELRKGYDLVMGNRFKGGIAPGAIPPLNRLPITRSAPWRSSLTNGIRLVKS